MKPLLWMRLIRDSDPRPGPRSTRYIVLFMLALRMDAAGNGFASIPTLAKDAEVGQSTVRRHLTWARNGSYLVRTRRGHRLGSGVVIASEWRLTDPSQPLTGEQLTSVSTAQMNDLNRSDNPSQPLTPDPPRGLTTRGHSSSARGRERERAGRNGSGPDDELDLDKKTNALRDRECYICGRPWPASINPPADRTCRDCRKLTRAEIATIRGVPESWV